jgi:hypothetical protein
MSNINFNVSSPLGIEIKEIQAPDNLLIKELIAELTIAMDLPLFRPDGGAVSYSLMSKHLGKILQPDETLRSAKIPANDELILTSDALASAGGAQKKTESRISVIKTSIGLPLDNLIDVDVKNLLSNEPALMMTLHSYRTTLSQLEDVKRELQNKILDIEEQRDKLKEKNIATVLLLLGQIQIGFGTNLITNNSMGGWFIFIAGVAINLGALYFSFFGFKQPKRSK